MITSVRMVNFKNFADETVKLGPFTVIVGANASGKSNIRDAFRFLHGIGRGYTLAEILGGKYGPGGQREWEPIRGAPNGVTRLETRDENLPLPSLFSVHAEVKLDGTRKDYSIKVLFNPNGPDGFTVWEEELKNESKTVYTTIESEDPSLWLRLGEGPVKAGISRSQPALTQFLRHDNGFWRKFVSEKDLGIGLEHIRFLDFSPERMRDPSIPGAAMLGDNGENLPSVLEAICTDAQRGKNLMSWMQELTPMDVKDFDFSRDPSGRVHLQIVERNGRKVSAYSASDGTLRFLGILAALLGPNEGGLYFFEEIDNGIHPNRLWLLMDFIERQTAKGNIQVITTTHSPALLGWMNETTFEHTSVVYRDEYWADSVIRPIADLYNLRELRNSQGLGRLFTGGWLETALKFSEGDSDADHSDEDEDEDDWEQGVLE